MGVLAQVELPLAVPLILAGVRTALVLNVGTATLATFGGGGGLGVLITTGITTQRMPVLILGSDTDRGAGAARGLAGLAGRTAAEAARAGGGDMRGVRAHAALAAVLVLLSGCGLTSGSPMVDDVEPGSDRAGPAAQGRRL